MKKIKKEKEKNRKKKIRMITWSELKKKLNTSQLQYMKHWGFDK